MLTIHIGRRTALVLIVGVLLAIPVASLASDMFIDVSDDNVFHDDISWLADAGVTKGCNPPHNTQFCPKDNVTREQMAAFMHRLALSETVDAGALQGLTAYQLAAITNKLTWNRVGADAVTVEPGETVSVGTGCAVEFGEVTSGGGYVVGSHPDIVMVSSYPDADIREPEPANPDVLGYLHRRGWTVTWRNIGDTSVTTDFTATAICNHGGEDLANNLPWNFDTRP